MSKSVGVLVDNIRYLMVVGPKREGNNVCGAEKKSMELHEVNSHGLTDALWDPHKVASYNENGGFSPSSSTYRAAYDDYYRRQWSSFARGGNGAHVAMKTPRELDVYVLHLNDTTTSMTRNEIFDDLESNWGGLSTEETLKNTLTLALSVLFMIKFGPAVGQTEPSRYLQWRDGSLKGCIRGHFEQEAKLDTRGIRLPRSFDAWSIQCIGGIEIHFTDNLIDHLKFIEDAEGKKVLVFHHVSFLECHQR